MLRTVILQPLASIVPARILATVPFESKRNVRCRALLTGLAVLCVLLSLSNQVTADDPIPAGRLKFFETKIRPVLVKNCYSCHSSKKGKTKGGLALDTKMGIQAGGDSGHGIVPGDIDSSLIIDALKYESFEMPPKKQLPASVIADFERWVKMGAPDPRSGKSVVKNKSSIDFDKGRTFWAFQKLKKPQIPATVKWGHSDIDRLIAAKLEEKKLQPVGVAPESTLLRRDYINLIGLPPTPAQIAEYEKDSDPKKREKLIDRLLDSPQYGERWGRHWLDLARFAESNGRERNFLFPHAWRYRNYVIDSFNNDKPYDRFVSEQIAGDLLEPLPEQDPYEPKIGTGFLAIGPKQLNEGNREVFAMDLIDEQIDVVSRSTMALTASCARCHDHKFDPISTADYYSMAGIFRSTQTLFGRGGGGARQSTSLINISDDPETDRKAAEAHAQKITALTAQVKRVAAQIKTEQKNARSGKNKNKAGKKNKGNQNQDTQSLDQLRRRQRTLQQQLNALEKSGPIATNVAMGATEGKPTNCNILIRGEVSGKGKIVQRGFLTVLADSERQTVSQAGSGRLELARWITSSDNPLTARVAVNRIWQKLFGEGIVRTVDNFGETGERPANPELLDHLALRLIENDWSIKKTIREILLSQTYQLDSTFHAKNYEIDPDNRYCWRMSSRRLDAEVLRDSMLLVSGELNLERPSSSVVAQFKSTQGIGRGVTEETFNVDSPHRSVYLPVVRNAVPEPLRVFDFAEPSILVGDRQVTTVPTQALYLMNSQFVMGKARKLAKAMMQPGESVAQQIDTAYLSILTRSPTESERTRAEGFLDATTKSLNESNKSNEANELALAAFCQALFASSEFRMLQ